MSHLQPNHKENTHKNTIIHNTEVIYLQGTKDTVSSGSPNKADIQECTERPPPFGWLDREVLTSGLRTEDHHKVSPNAISVKQQTE